MENQDIVFQFDEHTYKFKPTIEITPLMYLILYHNSTNLDHNKFRKFVLKNKDDINKQNKYGNSSLSIACHSKNPDENIIKILINAGADLNLQTNNELTPLMLAI